jgi:hypothetical protein
MRAANAGYVRPVLRNPDVSPQSRQPPPDRREAAAAADTMMPVTVAAPVSRP